MSLTTERGSMGSRKLNGVCDLHHQGRAPHEVETAMTEIRNPILRKHYGKY